MDESKCELYKKLENSKVQCIACNHKCIIPKNKTGICGVRKNSKGELFLLTSGKVSVMNIDPIEKKPLYEFLPGTKTFSIGTIGCNFKCSWCQNFDISQLKEVTRNLISTTPKEIIQNAIDSDCKSIAYTYNEPTISVEFIKKCSILARKNKLKNIWVTNGYFSKECLDYMENLIDAMNIDLKSFKDEIYKKHCGAKLNNILNSIRLAYKRGIHIEITTLIIPGFNDSEEELKNITEFITSINKNIPWHISRFFPMYELDDVEITPIKTLEKAKLIGKKAGLKNIYIGNV